MIFELITGEYLFNPAAGDSFCADDDHLAQIIELLGHFPKNFAFSGDDSNEFFNCEGQLRYIANLKPWPLTDVLIDRHQFGLEEARDIASFLLPMLEIVPRNRASAADMLKHPWLNEVELEAGGRTDMAP